MLIDEATVTIQAGNGGDGAMHLHRAKYVPKGGPDGGNGGRGADVYLLGVDDITALKRFAYTKEVKADNGGAGGALKMAGRGAQDLIILIPRGTLITDTQTKETWEIDRGQKILIAKGGSGGRGNWEFRTSTNQTPRQFERGTPGQRRALHLSLQLIADIGLVGPPNVGKTSILNELTAAQAKVANYPFTTLEPNLGDMHGIIISDIPGLIQDAHKGKGLGFRFLKHIAKTKLLAFCISVESKNPVADLKLLHNEMKLYNEQLLTKPSCILLTKTDLVDEKGLKKAIAACKKFGVPILPVSIYDLKSITTLTKFFTSTTHKVQ